MANQVLNGVSSNIDLQPNIIRQPAALPASVRRKQFFKEVSGFLCFAMMLPTIIFTAAFEVFFLFGIILYMLAKKNKLTYEIEAPVFEGGKGVLLLGRDKERFSNIFVSDGHCRAHLLVMGSTGSGKTRFLMSVLYQSMVMGSGCIYVDGKADNTVFWLVFSICQRLDRIDDFVLINYLTTEDTLLREKNASIRGNDEILTNTMNPYSNGSAEQLRSMTVGLMRDSGGDGDMWKGRASSLLSGTMRFLTYARAIDAIQMSVMSIRDSMPLDNVLRIVYGEYNGSSKITIGDNIIDVKEMDFPEYAVRPLRKYLADLPGFTESALEEDEVDPECYKQHGFLTMQLTEALSDLSETYGHIFNAPIGEVDFSDLIYSRRILFVMLPALQRDPDALANLGKLIVATIRSALDPALGSSVEGFKSEVVDKKATNSDVPFYIILDEYGYYAVKGFAVVAAQARSLGVSVLFAGQDYAGFRKGNADEAESVLGNTNTKIAMKLEESNTVEIFVKRAGKRNVPMMRGVERKVGEFSDKYINRKDISYEERNVIDELDLFGQTAGEAHIVIGDKTFRVNLFALLVVGEGNGTTKEVEFARINRFLMVRPPKPDFIQNFKEQKNRVFKAISGEEPIEVDNHDEIDVIFNSFEKALADKNNTIDSSIYGVVSSIIGVEVEKPKAERKSAKKPKAPVKKEKDVVGIKSDEVNESLKEKASEQTGFFENIINQLNSENGNKPMREQLNEAGKRYIKNSERLEKDVDESLSKIEKDFEYPSSPVPEKPENEMVKAKLNSLSKRLKIMGNSEGDEEEKVEKEKEKETELAEEFDDDIPFS